MKIIKEIEGYVSMFVRPSTRKRFREQADEKGMKIVDYLEMISKEFDDKRNI